MSTFVKDPTECTCGHSMDHHSDRAFVACAKTAGVQKKTYYPCPCMGYRKKSE